jgi:DNA-binding beta-propeller fold protein YncE
MRTALALVLAAAAVAATASAAATPTSLRVVAAVDLDGSPTSMVTADGDVWAALGVHGVARIDARSNTVVGRVDRPLFALAAGFGSVWGLDVFEDVLVRIDPLTNRVVQEIRVGHLPTGVAVGFGSVWVANQVDVSISRIDPATGRVTATISLGNDELWPGAIAAGPRGLWVVAGGGNALVRIDPGTSRVVQRLPAPGARTLAAARGALWVGLANSQALLRIDREAMWVARLRAPKADGYGPRLAGDGRALWVCVPGMILRGSPTGGPAATLPKRNFVSALVAAGDVWVADQTADRVLRLRDSR